MSQMVSVPFGSTRVNRILPLMGAEKFKTYGMSMPIATHWRKGTCEEVGCDAYRHGWVSTFDLSTDLGLKQYEYCKDDKTRSFSMQRPGMNLVKFLYKPGNRCFQSSKHRMPIGRPPRLYVAEGDWRGNPRKIPVRIHSTADDWVDDFANHQDRLSTEIKKG